jgi:aldehyde dehydrogenase (NAD+)
MQMDEQHIKQAFESKRVFFDAQNTKSYDFRIEQLKKLKAGIKKYEQDFLTALYNDMHKPAFEAYVSEIGVMYEEINHTLKHLKEWMGAESTSTPLVMQPATSKLYSEPLGIVLIIGPWNYPMQLLLAPLVGAIAAGNCVIIKPSDNTRHTAKVIEDMIHEIYPHEYISVVQGPGASVGSMLIEQYKFDHIFFTGSPPVGKQIMKMASAHLTPVTLELGGKSPAIIDKEVNLNVAAKRLAWAKYFNAGQTCVAPDYVLVHEDIKAEFINLFTKHTTEFFGEDPEQSESFTHIINDKRFNVLTGLLANSNIIMGGKSNAAKRYIAPTLVDNVSLEHPLMQEEIFGPILPILTWKEHNDLLVITRKHRHPLALYLYSDNSKTEDFVLNNIEFGGGGINCALQHLANPELPFGGVGNSGLGNYHGKYSFDCMSHKKAVVKAATWIDPPLRYAPYTENKMKWAKRFFN